MGAKVGLLIIATNKYQKFIQPLIDSANKYFLNQEAIDVEYFIFTDTFHNVENKKRRVNLILTKHEPWPWMTLGRYHIFSKNKDILSRLDYLFYCDADMLFCDHVGGDILSHLVATQHPGYFGRRGTPETNTKSLAYVNEREHMEYFAGGFNGGTSSAYLEMANTISTNINEDLENKIIAVWHDESHLNRYLIDNPPTKILDPGYCYGESLKPPFHPRLIALDKNHKELRG
jgi:histo-blood group ABO system transferase